MTIRSIAGLVSVAGALAVSAAGAQARVVARVARVGQVELVGSDILVAQGARRIDSIAPDGSVRPVAYGPGDGTPGGSGSSSNTLTFAASPAQLMFEVDSREAYGCEYGGCASTLSSGPVGGPYDPLPDCGDTGPAFAVSGNLLAFGDQQCDGPYAPRLTDPTSLIVRDLTGSAPDLRLVLPTGLTLDALALSGDIVAALAVPAPNSGEPAALLTWNVSSGGLRFDVPLPGIAAAQGLAAQSDGTVAFDARTPDDHCEIGTVAPAGALQRFRACSLGDITLHDSRVMVFAHDTLQTASLSGTPLGHGLVLNHVPLGGFDTDGTNLVFSIPTCAERAVVEQTSLLAPAPSALSAACPARIVSLRAEQHGRVLLNLRCPLGCRAAITLRAVGVPRADTSSRLAYAQRKLAPGQIATFVLHVRRANLPPSGRAIAVVGTRSLDAVYRVAAKRGLALR